MMGAHTMRNFMKTDTDVPMTDGVDCTDQFTVDTYMITNPKWNHRLNNSEDDAACRKYLATQFSAPVGELFMPQGSTCWHFNVVLL
jgi:hypothetical protein